MSPGHAPVPTPAATLCWDLSIGTSLPPQVGEPVPAAVLLAIFHPVHTSVLKEPLLEGDSQHSPVRDRSLLCCIFMKVNFPLRGGWELGDAYLLRALFVFLCFSLPHIPSGYLKAKNRHEHRFLHKKACSGLRFTLMFVGHILSKVVDKSKMRGPSAKLIRFACMSSQIKLKALVYIDVLFPFWNKEGPIQF